MEPTDCRSPDGVTVGLIDSIIFTCRILMERDWSNPEVQEALTDLRQDSDVSQVMDR